MTCEKMLTLTLLVIVNLSMIYGYGMMIDPISRSSAWRKKLPILSNINDTNLTCGGTFTHYIQNRGKCGVCGDDYSLPQPRPNENGGIYGSGIIVHVYRANTIIDVTVRLIDSDIGYFDFALCPLAMDDVETEDCFNRHPVPLAYNRGYYFPIDVVSLRKRDIVVSLHLPKNLLCQHCALRWQFRTETNQYNTKYAPMWRNCADITILKPEHLPKSIIKNAKYH